MEENVPTLNLFLGTSHKRKYFDVQFNVQPVAPIVKINLFWQILAKLCSLLTAYGNNTHSPVILLPDRINTLNVFSRSGMWKI